MQPVQKIKDIKNIRPRPHASKLVRADAFFGSLKKNLLLWNQSSVYTNVITHMRIGHSLTPNFLNTPLSGEERSISPITGVEEWKWETIESKTLRYLISRRNKNVSPPLSFFFFLTSVAYLSSFFSFWVKCWSLLFLITSLSVGFV